LADRDPVEAVRACYSTWSGTYYDEYYGQKASYPPVHRELLKRLLAEAGARTILDAGCGPASFLRDLADAGLDRYGFDLTPEMVAEARRVLGAQGVPADHVWEGSVLSTESFRPPGQNRRFDAAVCVGVFPHIPEEADLTVIGHLRNAVKEGGLVVIEARNQLFSLFTLNRPTWEFFANELLPLERLRAPNGANAPGVERALDEIQQHFRMDLPPVRKGKAGEPGYDEVLSRTHNPLVLREQFAAAGFTNVRLLFYHYHCLPPMTASHAPEVFQAESLAMEARPEDWRGYFMASAFLLAGTRA
jgi:SAM-dependent methyltransferase